MSAPYSYDLRVRVMNAVDSGTKISKNAQDKKRYLKNNALEICLQRVN